ncbi:MAG: hypothetical protein SAJ72_02765 [Jaaginema sp. PMC 1080.18]|nr:hypothetical protein [Jaaginema sp. PMC 1080.18]
MLNKISVYLTITGFDFEPEKITVLLGITLIHLDQEITRKLAELNAEIDIDLYVLSENT